MTPEEVKLGLTRLREIENTWEIDPDALRMLQEVWRDIIRRGKRGKVIPFPRGEENGRTDGLEDVRPLQ